MAKPLFPPNLQEQNLAIAFSSQRVVRNLPNEESLEFSSLIFCFRVLVVATREKTQSQDGRASFQDRAGERENTFRTDHRGEEAASASSLQPRVKQGMHTQRCCCIRLETCKVQRATVARVDESGCARTRTNARTHARALVESTEGD